MIKKILPLILILFSFNCKSIYVSLVTQKDVNKSLKVLRNEKTNQTIVFIPVIHVGKIDYYNSFKPIIDSLRNENYKIYVEGVVIKTKLSEHRRIAYKKKFRKIIGFNLDATRDSYLKEGQLKNYVLQDYKTMGVTKSDSILDLGIDKIIDSLETKYGTIELNDCDTRTSLNSEYKCNGRLKKFEWEATQTLRNDYISGELKASSEEKIVLIYGKSHWYFLYAPLNNLGFNLVQGKL